MKEDDNPSPCTSSCEINSATGLCMGCFRTLDEIARWSTFTDQQKREVLTRVESRRSGTR